MKIRSITVIRTNSISSKKFYILDYLNRLWMTKATSEKSAMYNWQHQTNVYLIRDAEYDPSLTVEDIFTNYKISIENSKLRYMVASTLTSVDLLNEFVRRMPSETSVTALIKKLKMEQLTYL